MRSNRNPSGLLRFDFKSFAASESNVGATTSNIVQYRRISKDYTRNQKGDGAAGIMAGKSVRQEISPSTHDYPTATTPETLRDYLINAILTRQYRIFAAIV